LRRRPGWCFSSSRAGSATGLLAFYKGLIAQGISEADIVQMSQTNPARL
jgi:hypothetical protein